MGKMIDLGKKAEQGAHVASQEGHSIQEMNYPEFHVEHDQIPVDADSVGKHIHATVKLHVKGHETHVGTDGKETKRTHFALKGIKIHPGNPEDGAEHEEGDDSETLAEHPHIKSKMHGERMSKIKKDYMKEGE